MQIKCLLFGAAVVLVSVQVACSSSSPGGNSQSAQQSMCADPGAACSATAPCCGDGNCVAGTCMEKAGDNEPCATAQDCYSGNCGGSMSGTAPAGSTCVATCNKNGAMECRGPNDDQVSICDGTKYTTVGTCDCSTLGSLGTEYADSVECDNNGFQTAVAGAPCKTSSINEPACSLDRKQALVCSGGTWMVSETCEGLTGVCELIASGSQGCPGVNSCVGCN